MVIKNERFEMRLDPETLERVDSWRRDAGGFPSRAEAMRRLIDLGLGQEQSTKSRVTMTDGEKVIALMLGDVIKHLKVDSDLDPDFIASAIVGGHLWSLKWQYGGVFHDHEDAPAIVKEVVDVLDMWSFIQDSYARLPKKDKDRVEKDAAPFGKNPKFPGFDGNNEGEWLGAAHFLIEKMERFTTLRPLNSHMPTLDGYRRMLRVFEKMRPTLTGGELSATQIIELLNARRHPE